MFIGYQTQCYDVINRVCNRGVCRNEVQRICRNVAIYDRVAYSCNIVVRVPVEVFDYDVQASVDIKFNDLPKDVPADEFFKLTLIGEDLTLKVNSSKNLIILFKKNQHESFESNLKKIKVKYEISFLDAFKTLAPLRAGIQNFELTSDAITFDMNGELDAALYVYDLSLVQKRFLRKRKTLINRRLSQNDFDVEAKNRETLFSFPLKKPLERGRFVAELEVGLNIPLKEVLNAEDLDIDSTKDKVRVKIK